MRTRCLNHVEHRIDVRLEGALQLFGRDIRHVLVGMLLARDLDQTIELAEPLDRLGDESVGDRLVAEIAGKDEGFRAFRFAQLPGLRCIVIFAEIGDGDLCALAREQHCGGAPDPAIRASDDRNLALHPPRPRIARLPFGLTVHLAFVAGHARLFCDRFDKSGAVCFLQFGHGSGSAWGFYPLKRRHRAQVPSLVSNAGAFVELCLRQSFRPRRLTPCRARPCRCRGSFPVRCDRRASSF